MMKHRQKPSFRHSALSLPTIFILLGLSCSGSQPKPEGEITQAQSTTEQDEMIERESKDIETLISDRKRDEAEDRYDAKLRKDPSVENRYLYALTLDDEKAWTQFNTTIKTRKDFYWGHLGRGVVYGRWKDFENAEKDLMAAMELKPHHMAAKVALAQVYSSWNKRDKAQFLYDQVLKAEPANFKALYGLGQMEKESGHIDRAISLIEKALKAEPEHGALWILDGELNMSKGDEAKALAAYEEAAKLKSDDVEVLLNVAKLARKRGLGDRALEVYETLHARGVKDDAIRRSLAELYGERKDWAKALPHLEHLVEMDPENKDWLLALAKAQEEVGNLVEALFAYDRLVKAAPANVETRGHLQAMLVRIGAQEASISGGNLDQIYQKNLRAVNRCYARAMKTNPNLKGSFHLQITIDEAGQLLDVATLKNTIKSPAVEACVLWSVRRSQYPEKNPTIATFPFDFK